MAKNGVEDFVLNLRPGCLDNPTRFDLAPIEAAMLWPDDPGKRTRIIVSCRAEHLSARNGASTGELLSLRVLADDSMANDLRAQLGDRLVQGTIAGWILRDTIAGAGRVPIDTAIRNASGKFRDVKMPRGRNNRDLTPRTISRSIWPRYRSVAHFWAAWLDHRDAPLFPCRLERMREFLALAETLRKAGETTQLTNTGNSVLPVGLAFRFAAEIASAIQQARSPHAVQTRI